CTTPRRAWGGSCFNKRGHIQPVLPLTRHPWPAALLRICGHFHLAMSAHVRFFAHPFFESSTDSMPLSIRAWKEYCLIDDYGEVAASGSSGASAATTLACSLRQRPLRTAGGAPGRPRGLGDRA